MPLVLDGTNGVSGVDGTASNPAIEGTDSNTGIFYPAADTVAIGTGGTEALRVNSSQNVGIGTSSPATKLQVQKNGKAFQLYDASTNDGTYMVFAGSNLTKNWCIGNQFNVNGALEFTQTSATGGTTIASTPSMVLDSSGNVGIGTSSPAVTLHAANTGGGGMSGANPSGEVSRLQQTPSAGSGGYVVQRLFLNKTSTANDGVTQSFEGLAVGGDRYALANIGGYIDNAGSGNSVSGYFAILTKPTNASITERARITSGGDWLVGTTTNGGVGWTFEAVGYSITKKSGTATTVHISFQNNNGEVGKISTSGTATTYGTSSDYRLKENVQPMSNALAKVAELKPVTYKWKVDGSDGQGFIAHELQSVCPDAVIGEKDAVETYIDDSGTEQTRPVYQAVDTSFLIATLTAAIQELNAKVEAQAAEIAALKAQP